MSRKTAERFQDPLEDQGWQQMRILLDQELPEKKRGFIWWPWLGATGTAALLLFSGYQLFFNQSMVSGLDHPEITKMESIGETSTDETQVKLDQIAPDPEINTTNIETQKETIVSKTNQENDLLKTKVTNSEIDKNLASDKFSEVPTKHRVEQKTSNNIGISDSNSVGVGILTDMNSTFPTTDIAIIEPEEMKMNGDQKNVDRKTALCMALDLPQFVIHYPYAIDDLAPIASENISSTIRSEKSSKWDVSISTGLTTGLNLAWAGFDGGAQLRYKASGKLAISIGANLWLIRSNQTFTSYSNNDPNSPLYTRDDQDGALVAIPEMQNLDSLGKAQPGSITYVQTIKKIRYLRIPVLVQFFPERALQPYLGIDQMILLSDGRNGLFESGAPLDYATNGLSSEPFRDLVRLSNTGIVLGLTYQLGKHFNCDFSYTHAGKSYLKYEVSQGNFNEYHRFLRLSVGYRF